MKLLLFLAKVNATYECANPFKAA